MKRKSRMGVKQTWILLLLSCAVLQPCIHAASCEKAVLPEEANAVLRAKFPKLQIVTIAALDQDERQAWSDAHPGICPGIAQGNFGPGHKNAYAVSLFRPLGNYRYSEALVLLMQEAGKYSVRVLSPESEVTAHIYVVWQQPPGAYKDAQTGRKIRAVWPIITYEAIEAGATAYYWKGTEFRSFVLSQ